MQNYHLYFLSVHIAAGMIALVVAPVAMIVRKGGSAHRKWGKAYFYAMAVVAVTAVIMSIYHNIPFLLMIAVFSFAMAATGYRQVYRKGDNPPAPVDWLIVAGKIIFGACLLVYAFFRWQAGDKSFAIISIVFGGISLMMGVGELKRFFRPAVKMMWLYGHIGNMSGAYIATVTAFLVTNVQFLPPVIVWVGPSLVGTPLIFYTVRKYRLKFEKHKKAPEAELELRR
jgi:hypothetical protein